MRATPAAAGDPSVLIIGNPCTEQEADRSGFLFIQTHTVLGVKRGYCFAKSSGGTFAPGTKVTIS